MNTSFITTFQQAQQWFKDNPHEIVSFDTELTSLDYLTMELYGMSFCNGRAACYIDYSIFKEDEQKLFIEFLQYLFADEIKLVIAHNSSFDLKVLYKFCKTEPKSIFCTMVAEHLLNENEPKNLKYLVKKYFHVDLNDWEYANSLPKHSQEFYRYGLNDAIYCWDLYKLQLPKLELNGLHNLFYNIEMPFIYVLCDLEINGILIDQDKMKELDVELKKLLYDIRMSMCKSADIEYAIQPDFFGEKEILSNFNFNSSPQLAELIVDKLGLEIIERTDTGGLSTGKETLRRLKGKHPFIDLLRQYKKATKLSNSFVSTFPKHINQDGRIRCNFHNTVAVTGRLSSSNPNLQQLPRATDEIVLPFDFRGCFVAPKGKVIVCCDYAGQEICWLGEVSQDPLLIKDIKDGKDVHLTVAKQIFNLDIPDECLYTSYADYKGNKDYFDVERHRAKNGVVFPIIYGKTSYGISKEFNITQKEAQRWIDGFFDLYPDVRLAIKECHGRVVLDKQVTNYFGRIRRFSYIDKRAFRQAFNFLIQSPSAEQVKMAMSEIRGLFTYWHKPNQFSDAWEAKFILQVHDEIVFEVDEKYGEIASDFVMDIMEDVVECSVPFTVKTSIGNDYGSTK